MFALRKSIQSISHSGFKRLEAVRSKQRRFFTTNNSNDQKFSKTAESFNNSTKTSANTVSSNFYHEQRFKSPVTWGTLVLGLISIGAAFVYVNEENSRKKEETRKEQKHFGKPDIGGPWVLVNQDGKPITDASYRGKYLLLYFGFTHCPDICPTELVKIDKVLKALGIFILVIQKLYYSEIII